MKVKKLNKKVLKSMIILTIGTLIFFYIAKIFFPEWFILQISLPNLVKIGKIIDNNWILHEICAIITSFITYFLYICSIKHKWFINWKELIIIVCCITINHLTYEFDTDISSILSICSFLIIPLFDLKNSKLKSICLVFSIHLLSQCLAIKIRNLPFLLTNVNYISIFLMGLESYFWLLLFYFYNNLYT